jgi:hypothetical protein
MSHHRHRFLAAAALLALCMACAPVSRFFTQQATSERGFPTRLNDVEFWRLSAEFSEPSGSFPFDNFVSNEDSFQHIIPALKDRGTSGGAYLGVGPDQNFTYIIAFRPDVAFIVDIRRQNLLQHLLYKALIELSSDRADFLSRLFSRRRPQGLASNTSAQALADAYDTAPSDETLYEANLRSVEARLLRHHRFPLSADDVSGLRYVYRSFYTGGPGIHYSIPAQPRLRFPTYAEMIQQTDGRGEPRGYLATDANFRVLKDFEERNLIVPVVGNFAGEGALPAVGQYLRQRSLVVRVFYLSNVEQYLFDPVQSWKKFYANLAMLPVDPDSTLIRTYNLGVTFDPPNARVRLASVVDSATEFLRAVNDGQIRNYRDVINR